MPTRRQRLWNVVVTAALVIALGIAIAFLVLLMGVLCGTLGVCIG